VNKLRDIAPPDLVEGGFGRSHREVVEMVLSFSAVYAAVVTVTRFSVLDALVEIGKDIVGKIVRFLDSSNNLAHNLLKDISNNPSFCLKHPGVPDGSNGSGGTSNPLTETQT